MLEKKEYVYVSENIEIINPTNSKIIEIRNKIEKAKNGEDYSDVVLTKILMEELTVPLNQDYDFSKYSLEEIDKLLDNEEYTLYEELPEIIYNLSNILSNVIMHEYRETLLELKKIELEVTQGEISDSIDKIIERIKVVEDENKKISEEARINNILKQRKWHKGKKNGR